MTFFRAISFCSDAAERKNAATITRHTTLSHMFCGVSRSMAAAPPPTHSRRPYRISRALQGGGIACLGKLWWIGQQHKHCKDFATDGHLSCSCCPWAGADSDSLAFGFLVSFCFLGGLWLLVCSFPPCFHQFRQFRKELKIPPDPPTLASLERSKECPTKLGFFSTLNP